MSDPIPSNLAALRKARGLSTYQLAELSGVKQPLISRYEHRTAPKGLKSALAIAAALRVKVLDIWPAASPQRRPTPRPSHAAPEGAQRRRRASKNQGKAKG